ncbi:MAG: SH3 domain-containing protein [Candidatus Omnitrophota bacterium]
MIKIKTIIFVLCIIYFCSFSRGAQAESVQDSVSPQRQFARGNDYYEKGEYDNAIKEYSNIILQGYAGGDIYYNLAGAYFKKGNLGNAILNYKRAEFFMPRSADLNANYKFAKDKINGKIIPDKGIWMWRPVRLYEKFFTVNELIIVCSIMYLAILSVFIITMLFPEARKYRLWIVIFLAGGILFTSLIIYHKTKDMKSLAVTIVPEAKALFGPFDSATKFFTLKEGMIVRVINAKDDWYKVRRSDGKVAWVKEGQIEKVW